MEYEGCRVAYTPSIPEITDNLREVYNSCATILVDGTFWSDGELSETHTGTPLAHAIGHIPLSGDNGTIALLADVECPRKTFVHINNTNPILDHHRVEHRATIEAGWEIGYDGWQLAQKP